MSNVRRIIRPEDCQQHSPADALTAALADGQSVIITGCADSISLLDGAAKLLTRTHARVMRVNAPLDLHEFMTQIVPSGLAPLDASPEAGFQALTVPGEGYERIALLVDGAHLTSETVWRYLDFAFRAAPALQVVLAGQPALAGTLALAGLSSFRARFLLHLDWSSTAAAAPGLLAPPASLPDETAMPLRARYRMTPARLLAAAVVAAMLAQAAVPTIQPASLGSAVALDDTPRPAPVGTDAASAHVAVLVEQVVAGADPQNAPDPNAEPVQAAAAETAAVPGSPSLAELSVGPDGSAGQIASTGQVASVELVASVEPEAGLAPAASAGPAVSAGPAESLGLPLPPVPPQAPPRPRVIRPERAAAAAPARLYPADPRCVTILLRFQVGETPTASERSFMRNGCW